MKQTGWKHHKKLMVGVLLALGMGGGALVNADAKEYTTPITGVIADDTEYADIIIGKTTYGTPYNYYTFAEDSTIKIDGSKTMDLKSTISGETFKIATAVTTHSTTQNGYTYIVPNDHNLTLDVTAKDDAIGAGFLFSAEGKSTLYMTPSGETKINVNGAEGNAQKSYGIWYAVTNPSAKTMYIINNDAQESGHIAIDVDNQNGGYGIAVSRPEGLTIEDDQKSTFANRSSLTLGQKQTVDVDVKVSANKNATNALEESAGLYVDTNGAALTVIGKANLDVEGHGILVTGIPESGTTSQKVVVTRGGKITVRPGENGAERYSIYNAQGTVEYAGGSTAQLIRDATQIDGDIYLADQTTVKVGLYGSNAYFNGVIKETGTPSTMRLLLSDGATWNNVATNAANRGIDTQLTLLDGVGGLLHQTKDSGNVTIDRLDSKLFNIAYDHDASDPTKILGGDVTITTATSGSSVNVITDYDENMGTEAKQRAVLDALAKKLYYTNYAASAERNLSGKVSIAEGLTASSVSKYYAAMSLDESTGQGYLASDTDIQTPKAAEKQTQTEFTNYIDANPAQVTPYVEAGVYKNGVFTFTEDTKLTLGNDVPAVSAGAWLTNFRAGVYGGINMPATILDLGGHAFDLSLEADGSPTGISSVGVNALVEINNPGAMSISAVSTETGQTAALFANSGGQLYIHNGGEDQDKKIIKVRGSTNKSTNGAVIKTMNGVAGVRSYIKVDGLIDLEADTTDGVGMAEGLSAVASTIDVGGGKIIMTASGENPGVNYGGGAANNAIRAYGEFVTGNYGIVNVNVIKDEDTATGNAIAAGNNPVQISGNFSTVGGMGTKGKINVGLNTEDSYWVGNYNFGYGWGVTPGDYGVLSLFMGNKAKWMGYSKFATKLVMDSGAEWQGYSQDNAVDATIQNGAIWHHHNDSDTVSVTTLKSLTGGTSDATAGYIDMTGEKADKNVEIGNYSGYMNVFYAHEGNGEETENYTGGDIIIKAAAEGSQISLITDNTGINMTSAVSVDNVLNALAGKLYYLNYETGERNLTGYVKIADGLTAGSAALCTGPIKFNETSGQGTYFVKKYDQVITGDVSHDTAYVDDGVRQDDNVYHFTEDPTKITADAQAVVSATENDITIVSKDTALAVESTAEDGYGILAEGGHTVTFEGKELSAKGNTGALADGGNLTVKGNFNAEGTDLGIDAYDGGQVTVEGKTTVSNGTTGIAASGEETAVKLTGDTEISATGTAIYVDTGANVTVSGGQAAITGALEADGGSLTIGDDNGMTAKSDLSVSNEGNMEIDVIGKNSTLEGGYKVKSGGKLTVKLQKGGTWTLADYTEPVMLYALRAASDDAAGTLDVNGGATEAEAGNFFMTQTTDGTISNYSGWLNVYYDHTGNGESEENYTAGNLIIQNAAEGSHISLITDRDENVTYKEDNVVNILKALAGKLYYSNYSDGHLTGQVKLADGLTTSSAILQMGDIEFQADKEGKGKYKVGSLTPGFDIITPGDYETYVMKGVRSAATTSFHAWRDNMQDLYRAADLADEDGIFAKVLAGKTESDVHGVNETNTYKGAQVGYAKALKNGWHTGIAFDYRDGDSDYLLGGKGDDKLYSFGLYGVKKLADNSYFRVAAKVGRVENKYDVYNEIRTTSLHGEYGVAAYGLTAEYGKTFGKADGYVTPKVQLTFAHVGGKDYTASTAKGATMDIYQDAYKSFVGRIGVEAGLKKAKGNFYGGLYLAHEFSGDTNTRYFATDGGWKSTAFDGKDTWVELVLGGSYQAGSRAQIYADLARDFGGDFEHQWKLDAGVRFSF